MKYLNLIFKCYRTTADNLVRAVHGTAPAKHKYEMADRNILWTFCWTERIETITRAWITWLLTLNVNLEHFKMNELSAPSSLSVWMKRHGHRRDYHWVFYFHWFWKFEIHFDSDSILFLFVIVDMFFKLFLFFSFWITGWQVAHPHAWIWTQVLC